MGKLLFLKRRRMEPLESRIPSDGELVQAVFDESYNQVEALLQKGANPNAVETLISGSGVLGIAAYFSRIAVVKLLLSHGADVTHRDKLGGTPLHQATKAGLKRSLTITEVLLNHGADINAKSAEGWTPLMLAVEKRQNVELVKLLLERGADPTLRNDHGKRAVDLIPPGTKDYDLLKSLLEPVS